MTRTHIISADGTRFVPLTTSTRNRRKVIAIICAILAAPFLIAAMVGIYLGATGQAHAPSTLPTPLPAAIKACDGVKGQYQGYCISLYLRPAYTAPAGADGSSTHTPAGPALVKECLTQGLDNAELGACLTQPIG